MNSAKSKKLAEIFLSSPVEIFSKSQMICRPDDNPHSIFYLEKGYVKSYSLTEDGDEKVYLIYKPGEIFPILYTFDHQPLTKFYQAMSECIVRRMSADYFMQLINNDNILLMQVTKSIVNFLDIYRNRIDNLEFTDARSRLISRLLYLALRFGEEHKEGVRIGVRMTHYDIAGSIALVRETVSRELEKLGKQKLIKVEEGHIIILDRQKLENLLNHTEKL